MGSPLVPQDDTVQRLVECSTRLQAVRRTAQACGALRVLQGCVDVSSADVLSMLDTDFVARAVNVIASVPAIAPKPPPVAGSFQEVALAAQQAGTGRVATLLVVHPEYLNERGEVRGGVCNPTRRAAHTHTHMHWWALAGVINLRSFTCSRTAILFSTPRAVAEMLT